MQKRIKYDDFKGLHFTKITTKHNLSVYRITAYENIRV